MQTTHLPTLAPPPDALNLIEPSDSMHLAYDRVTQLLATHPIERLEPINVEVPNLVTLVLGAIPKIMRHRALLAQLVTFDLTFVDELEQYALALGYAHAIRRAADLSPLDVRELVSDLRETRRQLLLDARALAGRGLIDGRRLDGLEGGSRYLAVAFDVIGLAELLLESWEIIAGKTGVSENELRRARADANRLVVALGRRAQSERAEDPDERQYRQIYSLLARAYSEVRGALRFVRRGEGDANWIAPSPYPGRAKRSKKQGATQVNGAGEKKESGEALSAATGAGRGRTGGVRRTTRLSFKRKFTNMTTHDPNNTQPGLSTVSPAPASVASASEASVSRASAPLASAPLAADPENPASQDPVQFHLGFERVRALLTSVSIDSLEPINLEVPATCATVIGAYPEIIELRPQLESLSTFDISHVDNLRDYALALGHTHSEHRSEGGTSDKVSVLAAKCLDNRDLFHADATALAKRGLLDESRVAKLRGGNSYRMIAFDVIGLTGLFLSSWETIKDKTALTQAEMEEARTAANQLVSAIGLREQAEPATSEVSLLRQQAYTLLVRAYNETRDAIAFIRRAEGDVDRIAPSLYAGRGRRVATEVVTPASPATPVATAPTEVANTPANNIPVGFPGSSPFSPE